MLGELSGAAKIFIITGCTDMRRSIDGLMAIIRDTCEMDPYANAPFLFCGRKKNTIKALHFDKDGIVLYLKRLGNGRFQWPKDASEVRPLSRQEFRWLMEGLSMEQPKAIRSVTNKKTFSFVHNGENKKIKSREIRFCNSYPHSWVHRKRYPCTAQTGCK